MSRHETRAALIAEFGTAEIDLSAIAEKYLGMSKRKAEEAASRCKLPFPTYRIGSQKSPVKVSADALARVIEARKLAADKEWSKFHAA
ncbi:pyocin activator PrtN family protein [Nevskia ramosa]|uniref:pyocin activator PrtN family protein n=1 Tax=Nevskia ramosa TaxID=64002 RepID=UPI003D104F43